MSTDTLLQKFQLDKVLNTDQAGRRIVLQGSINNQPALLLAERGAFTIDTTTLKAFTSSLTNINKLEHNDIYSWYLASGGSAGADLKINLIHPCTDKHIKKYSFQQARVVLETPQIYADYIRPYMQLCREQGRLNWVFNILEGRKEQENVLYRSPADTPAEDAFLLLPDLNWDRTTLSSLHLLALPLRRDIWSVRDLRKGHAAWLRGLRRTLAERAETLYPGVERDMLKFYIHYQPTYYHFHVHVVHIDLDPTATQAVGKALGLDHVISQLETMAGGEEEAGMHLVELSYTVGEASELWNHVFLPLKNGLKPDLESI